MTKEQIKELLRLEKNASSNFGIPVTFALAMAGLLMFISTLMGIRDHKWGAYVMGTVGVIGFIYAIKERKKEKIRIKELRGELGI